MSGLLVARRGSLHPRRASSPGGGYADEVAADSPVAWWRFEETSGSTVADEVGSNDGTVFGANLDVSGAPGTGSAASFDGVDDYVNIPDASALRLTGSITLEAWVYRPSAATGFRTVFAKGRTTSVTSLQTNYSLRVTSNRQLSFRYDVGSTDHDYRTGNDAVPVDEWAHVAFTFTYGTGSSAKPYVNGTEVSASWVSGSGGSTPNTNSEPLLLGVYHDQNFWSGRIDEVALYTTALSAARIEAHYNAGAA